jgi:hypothetical protein
MLGIVNIRKSHVQRLYMIAAEVWLYWTSQLCLQQPTQPGTFQCLLGTAAKASGSPALTRGS